MKLNIDGDACTGHGLCYSLAPQFFEDDEQGYGHVIGDGVVPNNQLAEARTAVANCPEKAISFVDDLNLSLALNEETTS
jgi:ferredoxin